MGLSDYVGKHLTMRFGAEWERETRPAMGRVFDWAEEGIPHFLIEYPEDYRGRAYSAPYERPLPLPPGVNRSVAATLLGVCDRGHLVELMPHPAYMAMRIGCPRGRCPGIIHPATEDQVTVFRLLGKTRAEAAYIEAWAEARGARRRG